MIATPLGEKAVEGQGAGDQVLTSDGRAVPVKWLAVQEVNIRLMHPKKVNPVCIKADALDEGLPSQDLYLSKDHAIEIDGTLYNAGALVNGSTIYQVAQMPLDGFKYYHVDTGTHELLVANGVGAESYIDYAGTEGFVNGDARVEGESIDEMALPRVSSSRQVPAEVRARLQASHDEIAA